MASMEEDIFGNEQGGGLDAEIAGMSHQDLMRRIRLMETEIRVLNDDYARLTHEQQGLGERVKENIEKIKLNNQLPYLVGNVVEVLDVEPEDEDEEEERRLREERARERKEEAERRERERREESERRAREEAEGGGGGGAAAGGGGGTNRTRPSNTPSGRCVVLKTSTRQTVFLPMAGLVDPAKLTPGDLVGVNKDSYLILSTLPPEYDARVKAMEVDERPTEDYTDIGGLDKQIQELREAIVLPITHGDRFKRLGIRPPKGVLLYGPPGTGKTLIARACAAQTNATFLKLAGPALVQMFIGDGAKMVRDAFALAKEKAPAIVFIDEIDAIGTTRRDSELSGDREVQRTMLELLNQLDGFASSDGVKIIAATNRPDTLDPALLRSGRLDRKIEFPHPNEASRAKILRIHSRKMNVDAEVNYEELARSTDDFNAAQLKAVCVEAGMLALRRDATVIRHEDFNDAVGEVQAKKKTSLQYYA